MVLQETNNKNIFQLIVFKLGNAEYALRVDQITEVIITPGITRILNTPSHIKGLINVRGLIIPVLCLEEKFNIRSGGRPTHHYTLVIENDNFKVGLLVHEVPTLVTITSADIDRSAHAINRVPHEIRNIKGVINVGERKIVLIDIFQIPDEGLPAIPSTMSAA